MSKLETLIRFIKIRLEIGDIRVYDKSRKATETIIGIGNDNDEVYLDLGDGEIKTVPIGYLIKNCRF